MGQSVGTFYLRSFGCQMNEHDAERICAVLEDIGLSRVSRPDEATVLVFNTCTVRRSADERLAGHLGEAERLKREDPRRIVAISGCLPQAERTDLFARFPFVDIAVGPLSLHCLQPAIKDALATRAADSSEARRPQGFFDDSAHFSAELPAHRGRSFQAWVQVMSGCTNFCSYCIVPYVRGPERSRHPEAIVAEVARLVAEGVCEVTLLGQNVNAYGHDLAPGSSRQLPEHTFAKLLTLLDSLAGLERIRFMTSHPKDLSDQLVSAIAELRTVCEHVHLPAQSGSNAVLAAMRRGYTVHHYLERVRALRAAAPGVSVTTDLIVGFPGESEADFQATLDLVQEAAFDACFTFVYSPRPGTDAASMPGQVPEEVKHRRIRELVALTQQVSLIQRSRFIGRRLEVLVEGPSRHGTELRGRTRHNITVNFDGDAKPGDFVELLVTDATSTTLRGTM